MKKNKKAFYAKVVVTIILITFVISILSSIIFI